MYRMILMLLEPLHLLNHWLVILVTLPKLILLPTNFSAELKPSMELQIILIIMELQIIQTPHIMSLRDMMAFLDWIL